MHVDDVAEGHALALERGRIGERYILGGEDMSLRDIFVAISKLVGRAPPRVRLHPGVLVPLAVACEWTARATGWTPIVTRDTLAMARKKMFFSSAKARGELGYAPRPAMEAIADAVAWFRSPDYSAA